MKKIILIFSVLFLCACSFTRILGGGGNDGELSTITPTPEEIIKQEVEDTPDDIFPSEDTDTPVPTVALIEDSGYLKEPNSVNSLGDEIFGNIPEDSLEIIETFFGSAGGGIGCIDIAPQGGFPAPQIIEDWTSPNKVEFYESIRITTCGWNENEEVTLKIEYPDGSITEKRPDWNSGSIEREYHFRNSLQDGLGLYTFRFIGETIEVQYSVEFVAPEKPRAYMNEEEFLLLAFGFLPNEKITISAYFSENPYGSKTSEILGGAEFTANEYGELIIKLDPDAFQFGYDSPTLFLVTGEHTGMVDPYLEYRYKGFTDPWDN